MKAGKVLLPLLLAEVHFARSFQPALLPSSLHCRGLHTFRGGGGLANRSRNTAPEMSIASSGVPTGQRYARQFTTDTRWWPGAASEPPKPEGAPIPAAASGRFAARFVRQLAENLQREPVETWDAWEGTERRASVAVVLRLVLEKNASQADPPPPLQL
jgi:hypothetical protein